MQQSSDINETKTMFRSTGVVGLMTLLSRVLGLFRDIFFARLFGAFPIMDAFFVSFKIPSGARRMVPTVPALLQTFANGDFRLLKSSQSTNL